MRPSSDRAQFEPVVALVAVLAVSAGLVAYADALGRTLPDGPDRETARIALDAVHDGLRVAGVALPGRLDEALRAVPDRWQANATLRTRAGSWHHGPPPPGDGMEAQRRVSVKVGPSDLRPGKLRVVVWQ